MRRGFMTQRSARKWRARLRMGFLAINSSLALASESPSRLLLASRSFFPTLLRAHVQTLHAIAQCVTADLQLLGGFRQIVAVLLERIVDELFFKIRHQVVE